jgi:hypothetical protein
MPTIFWDLLEFGKSVVLQWSNAVTAPLITFLWLCYERLTGRAVPMKVFLWILGVGLFAAFFGAWRDQWLQNRVGREAGSLAFVAPLLAGLTHHDNLVDAQVKITLRNIATSLLKYHVDNVSVEIESKQQEPVYLNRGGYVYAGQDSQYRLHPIKDIPSKEPLSGILEYRISYNFVGNKFVHHSRKKISFEFYFSGEGTFTFLEEHED